MRQPLAGDGQNPVFELALSLNEVGSTPGWEEIEATAFCENEENTIARLLRGVKLLRPATATLVEKSLSTKGTETREMQEAWITHTVAFAKNVLEAESSAHSRAAIQGFDIADITPTGEHALFKQRGSASHAKSREVDAAAKKIIDGREKLPVGKPDGIRLHPPDLVIFYGMAELYGMARAGYSPKQLPDYLFASDVQSVNVRTRSFLANHARILEALGQAEGPVEQLNGLGVSVPDAIRVADSPSVSTIMSAASDVAASHS